jgi:predicted PurR-regulated permease PerM
MFIALLFLPLMRWFNKKKVPKAISIFVVVLIIAVLIKLGGELIQLSSREISSAQSGFFEKAKEKLTSLAAVVEDFFGIDYFVGDDVFSELFNNEYIAKHFGDTLGFIGRSLSMTLMTAFFVVLWLAESVNFQQLLNSTILKQRHASIKTFMKIEKDIITFLKVKFIVSLLTGIGISLACVFFGVSFPIFWGLFAFLINFVQMVGSVISVVLLAVFGIVELDVSSMLFFFVLTITGVQVVFGGVLEPIFMGKSFSINIITILVMLSLWGFLWGIPGLIMSIPITVSLKIILEQFPRTKLIADLLSGGNQKIILPKHRKMKT